MTATVSQVGKGCWTFSLKVNCDGADPDVLPRASQLSRDEVSGLYSRSYKNNCTEIIQTCSPQKSSTRVQDRLSGFAMLWHRSFTELETILHHNSHLLCQCISSHWSCVFSCHCRLSAQIQNLTGIQLQICHRYVLTV